MLKSSFTIRVFIACSLIFSLGIAGLSPVFMRAASAGVSVTADESTAKRCCCGTPDGNCCGKVCCGVDAPKPKRTPVPQENRHDLGGAFWLVCGNHATLPAICIPEGTLFLESGSTPAGGQLTTLQALQVLLQT